MWQLRIIVRICFEKLWEFSSSICSLSLQRHFWEMFSSVMNFCSKWRQFESTEIPWHHPEAHRYAICPHTIPGSWNFPSYGMHTHLTLSLFCCSRSVCTTCSTFQQLWKRSDPHFHRPQSTIWSTQCKRDLSHSMRQMVVISLQI